MYRFSALITNLAAFLYGSWNIECKDDTTKAVNGWLRSALMMVTHSHHTTLFSVSKYGHMTALYVCDLLKQAFMGTKKVKYGQDRTNKRLTHWSRTILLVMTSIFRKKNRCYQSYILSNCNLKTANEQNRLCPYPHSIAFKLFILRVFDVS